MATRQDEYLGNLTVEQTLVAKSTVSVEGVLTAEGGIVGDVTGDVTGSVLKTAATYTESGAIDATKSAIYLNSTGGALAMTISAPDSHEILLYQIGGTDDIVVTFTDCVINNTGNNTATFNATGEALVVSRIGSGRYIILSNVDGVALSTVS